MVSKLLTGFDAPPCTYLYIDKSMHDHRLFQAICRVNRLDGEEKDFGYIVDYKQLFGDLANALNKYTAGAFEGYAADDIEGLIKDRLFEARKWYREVLKTEITRVLPKYEKITGLKATDWQTKYMTTRWGTCNSKTGKIWLNLQLVKKTPKCLEYVILHELIHLIEKNHGDRFVSLMDKYMPMWREIKVTLNDQILDFME